MEFAREMLHALMILVMIPGTKSKERKKRYTEGDAKRLNCG